MSTPRVRTPGSNPLVDPAILLRLEGLMVALAAVVAYFALGGPWWLFLLLLFTPDLLMAGYLAGPRVGAACYNLVHSSVGPIMLLSAALLLGEPGLLRLSLIWLAHVGVDRLFGYGLKFPTSFQDTHLGTIGRRGAR